MPGADRLEDLRCPCGKKFAEVKEEGISIGCRSCDRPVLLPFAVLTSKHSVLEKAKLRRIRFHDLRHTFASRLIQNGESLVYVKDQLGHHSIKATVDVYGHLVPGANKAAVDRLDQTAILPEDWRERIAERPADGRHQTALPGTKRLPNARTGLRIAPQPREKNWWS